MRAIAVLRPCPGPAWAVPEAVPEAVLVQRGPAMLPVRRHPPTRAMPVYEYQCKSCKRDFEYQQRMSDPEKDTCEACGGPLERVISRTSFALKGGGWYKDLYSSSKPESIKSADSSASSDSGGSSSAASDSSSGSTGSTSAAGSSGSTGSSGSSSGASSSGGTSAS